MQSLGLGRGCIPLHACYSPCRRTASPSPPAPPRPRNVIITRLKTRTAAVRASAAQMERGQEVKVVKLRAVEATPESFAPFGQVIGASPDGDEFGPHDAHLDLSRGIPRFYIMRLQDRPLKFSTITHHASVTQCLGSIGGQDWYLGVAKPSIVDGPSDSEQSGAEGRKLLRSAAGHYYLPPDPAEVVDHTTHYFKKHDGITFVVED